MACGSSTENMNRSKIQGVSISDEGDITVTFEVSSGQSIEEILDSKLGEENTVVVSGADEDLNKTKMVYWYEVETGGIVTRVDNIYRFGPEAEVTDKAGGVSGPPTWVMVYSVPEEDELFQTKDSKKLADEYGINLNFSKKASASKSKDESGKEDKEKASSQTDADGYSFSEVDRWSSGFSDGYCLVDAFKENENKGFYILSETGDMTQVSGPKISNFCKGTALSYIGTENEDYANAIINAKGEVVWSIEENGDEAVNKFFSGTDVTEISSFFCVADKDVEYKGYFPVEFEVDSFDYTGTYIGILNSDGEWVVEPTTPSHGYAWTLQEYGIVTNTYIFDYMSGAAKYYSGDTDEDSTADEEREIYMNELQREWYFLQHDNFIFSESNDIEVDFERNQEGFYDKDGNFVIDLSGYLLRENPEFVDGYAILEIENEQGGKYLTVIDSSGTQMFEPIKDTGHGELSEGIFFMENGENGYFMNVKGEKVGEITGKKAMPFQEKKAWIETNEGWNCIDSEGKIVF